MKKLIEAYLKHNDCHIADVTVTDVRKVYREMYRCEMEYECHVVNIWVESGVEIIYISVSNLLMFLFERGEK